MLTELVYSTIAILAISFMGILLYGTYRIWNK